MSMAFTDGKLFFSSEYPGLYLEKPGDLRVAGAAGPQAPHPRPGSQARDRHRSRRRSVPRRAPLGDRQRALRPGPRADDRDAELPPVAQGDDRRRPHPRRGTAGAAPRPRRAPARRAREARRRAHVRARGRMLSRRRRRDRGDGRPPARGLMCACTWPSRRGRGSRCPARAPAPAGPPRRWSDWTPSANVSSARRGNRGPSGRVLSAAP